MEEEALATVATAAAAGVGGGSSKKKREMKKETRTETETKAIEVGTAGGPEGACMVPMPEKMRTKIEVVDLTGTDEEE